jgi:hypothetical protein
MPPTLAALALPQRLGTAARARHAGDLQPLRLAAEHDVDAGSLARKLASGFERVNVEHGGARSERAGEAGGP